jgi:hypothetical protein
LSLVAPTEASSLLSLNCVATNGHTLDQITSSAMASTPGSRDEQFDYLVVPRSRPA